MKKQTNKGLVLLAAVLLAGCAPKPHAFEPLKGDGNIVQRTIEVADFNTIVMEMPVEIHYVESEEPYLRITGDSNLIAAMNPRVKGHQLILAVCWPQNAMAAQGRFTMLPTRPLTVEAGSTHLENFGWNGDIWVERDFFKWTGKQDVPCYTLAPVEIEGDSMVLLSSVRLEDRRARLDVCNGPTDTVVRHIDSIRTLRQKWVHTYESAYYVSDGDVHIN